MIDYGFVRIGAAVPEIEVAHCSYNRDKIMELIEEAVENKLEILVFPELCLTGYTCGDLFHQETLIKQAENCIKDIMQKTLDKDLMIVIGAPVKVDNQLFNCAIVIKNGNLLGIIPKTYLPNYNEFYEKRWFSSAVTSTASTTSYAGKNNISFGTDILFQHKDKKEFCLGIEICEDLWAPIPPSSLQSAAGANIILNLSASNDVVGKSEYRKSLVAQQSARCVTGYVYASAGFGESSTDLVFGGHSMIFENGSILAESKKYELNKQLIFSEIDIEKMEREKIKNNSFADLKNIPLFKEQKFRKVEFKKFTQGDLISRRINPRPFVPADEKRRNERCEEIFNIQINGLAKRIIHIGTHGLLAGISGGLDSTLALLVCVKACDKLGYGRDFVKAITMPGFGTTDRTYNNAVELIKILGADFSEIDIKDACLQHFKDIGHDENNHDVTYENIQARERTKILMNKANQLKGIVIGTGDLSEFALGWATYNGDHMSMYGVNAGVPKTLVRYLVKWIADNAIDEKAKNILYDILDTPVSPELLPPDENGDIQQKTEEIVGPYELHDFFLYNVIRFGFEPNKILYIAKNAFDGVYDEDTIKKWLISFYKRFFMHQFKRSCMPDGPKVGSICLSPRGDWRMPSDAIAKEWLENIN